MKKKYGTVKVVLLTLLVFVLLTWILPAAYFQGSYTDQGRVQMGIFDLFSYPITALSYFGYIAVFLLVIGGFYGILGKIDAYRTLLDKLANAFKKHGKLVISIMMVLIAVITSICGLQMGLMVFYPFLVALIFLMGYDKIVAALTLVGSSMIGIAGSTYAYGNTNIIMSTLSLKITSNLLVKVIILVLALALLIANTIIYIAKTGRTDIDTKDDSKNKNVEMSIKSRLITCLLAIFLGTLGIHRFYTGKTKTGFLYLLTGGVFGIGYIVDIICILAGVYTDSEDKLVYYWTSNEAETAKKEEKKTTSKAKTSKTTKDTKSKKSTKTTVAAKKEEEVKVVKEEKNPYSDFIPAKGKGKHKVWPLATVLCLMFVIMILGFVSWNNAFKISLFEDVTEDVTKYELFGFALFGKLLGNINAFGGWNLNELVALMILAAGLLMIIYKVKFSEGLEAFAEGASKAIAPAVIVVLIYTGLVIVTYHPFQLVIYKWLFGFTKGFNVITSSIAAILASTFNADPLYAFQSVLPYLASLVSKKSTLAIAGVVYQSMYGVTMLVAPTSVVLMTVLTYLGVSYKEWLKNVWKLLLELVALMLIIFTILALI